ncbi:MAG: DUF4160 domain-containing protein [Caldilineaceae bacterium]
MAEISRFYGIVITMYPEAGERHNTPHFHVRHGGDRATLAIATGDLLAGALPRPQVRLVQAWVELHRAELQAIWAALTTGQATWKIDPLK